MIIQTRLQQRLKEMKQMEFMFPKHIWSMYLQQDITEMFFEDIAWKLATGANTAIFTTGDAGIGKSLLTANVSQITSWIAKQITGQPTPFTVEGNLKSEITGFIRMLSDGRSYHSYVLDELLSYHGQGSQITMDSMKNIMKASARFEQINWAIVGIELLPMHVYNYVLRAEAKDYDETNIRKSKAFIAEIWCVPKGSIISSNPHPKAVEQMQVGEHVLTHDGNYSAIEAISERPYEGTLIEISTYGRTLKATANHVVPYVPSPRRYAKWKNALAKNQVISPDNIIWAPISQVRQGDFVWLPRVRKTVDRTTVRLEQRSRVGSHEIIKSVVPLTQNFLKLCGLFTAEGWANGNVVSLSLGPSEGWLANDAKVWFSEVGVKSRWFFREREGPILSGKSIQLDACSSGLASFFRTFYNTNKEKELPSWMIYLPTAKQRALLAGMWAGDGGIICSDSKGYTQYRLYYTTASPALAHQVTTILMRLGFLPYLASHINSKTFNDHPKQLYQVHVTGKQIARLGKILGGRFTVARGRGQQCIKTENGFLAPITKVSQSQHNGHVFDLQVRGQSSYVVNGIAVHNCKLWEDLYGNYMQVGKVTVPIVLSEEWIAEYHLKEKAPKVASVLASEGMVERDAMKRAYEHYYGKKP